MLGSLTCINQDCISVRCGKTPKLRDALPSLAINLSSLSCVIFGMPIPTFLPKKNKKPIGSKLKHSRPKHLPAKSEEPIAMQLDLKMEDIRPILDEEGRCWDNQMGQMTLRILCHNTSLSIHPSQLLRHSWIDNRAETMKKKIGNLAKQMTSTSTHSSLSV
ncbi:hypothetical protein EDC96DRAFT_540477 [Choanephora cucurbitarum]|nr:hypothetical protein EDC96DRAFT_540477 [Choanephora cucurbitarum]